MRKREDVEQQLAQFIFVYRAGHGKDPENIGITEADHKLMEITDHQTRTRVRPSHYRGVRLEVLGNGN